MKRFLSIFLLLITALYFYAFNGVKFISGTFSVGYLFKNFDIVFPTIMAFIAAHGLWHNNRWGTHVSQFTLGLIAFPSLKFLLGHLSFAAGLANFIFPLTVILFLLLIFV